MKGNGKEDTYQVQLIKCESSHHQSMPNKKEMKITSQRVNHNFLVIFELKINAK
jgi:hypothetical protein